jgi:hypothetical protein
MTKTREQKNEEMRVRPRLLWVKIPAEYAKRLGDTAEKIGVSRADYMRLILINHVNTDSQSFTINTQTK